MKDIGEAAYIFGVKIKRDHPKKMLALSQEHYIRKVLEKFYRKIITSEKYLKSFICKTINSLILL
jgi:hypothetical protein